MTRTHPQPASVPEETAAVLNAIGVPVETWSKGELIVRSPITGELARP